MNNETGSNGKKVLKTKTYTITVKHLEDGSANMCRRNDGFSPLELIGIADFIAIEIRDQIKGWIIPTTVTREVVVDEEPVEEKPNEMEVRNWCNKMNPTARLANLLWVGFGRHHISISDINKNEFMSLRNAGPKTWQEFVKLRDRILDDKK